MNHFWKVMVLWLLTSVASAATVTLTFENGQLGTNQQLPEKETFWNGTPRGDNVDTIPKNNGMSEGNNAPFFVNGVSFSNTATYDNTYSYWGWYGFGVSNASHTLDATTKGSLTQEMIAWPNSSERGNYLVGYWGDYDYINNTIIENPCTITFMETITPQSVLVGNTAYTYLTALQGSEFGGGQLAVDDALSLEITASKGGLIIMEDENHEKVISVSLAKYLSEEQGRDVLDVWEFIDLSDFGEVDTLYFNIGWQFGDPSGIGNTYGLVIPTYFALDDFVYTTSDNPPDPGPAGSVPEPGSWYLFLGVLSGLFFMKKRLGKDSRS